MLLNFDLLTYQSLKEEHLTILIVSLLYYYIFAVVDTCLSTMSIRVAANCKLSVYWCIIESSRRKNTRKSSEHLLAGLDNAENKQIRLGCFSTDYFYVFYMHTP